MANTKSAKKAVRKIARRTEVNTTRRSRMRTYVRRVEEAIQSGDKAAAQQALRQAQPEIARAAQKREEDLTPRRRDATQKLHSHTFTDTHSHTNIRPKLRSAIRADMVDRYTRDVHGS